MASSPCARLSASFYSSPKKKTHEGVIGHLSNAIQRLAVELSGSLTCHSLGRTPHHHHHPKSTIMASAAGRSVGRSGHQALLSVRHAGSSSWIASTSVTHTSTSAASALSPKASPSSRPFSSSAQSYAAPPAVHLPALARKDPQLYQALRPPPRSAFVALGHRLKLIKQTTDPVKKQERIALLIRACTHPTFPTLVQRAKDQHGQDAEVGVGRGLVRNEDKAAEGLALHLAALDAQYVNASPEDHNASMASLGNSLLGLIASEYLHLRFPNLPNRVLKAALSAYVGPTTLSDVGAELGVTGQNIVRWDKQATVKTQTGEKRIFSRDAFADAMRAIVALIFQEQGLSSARDFVHVQLLSRLVPIVSLLKFDNPKRSLSELMRKLGKERPQSRMIAETGRLSINPVFVVGVWSGKEKLGEGTGSAIRMAEYRAAEDALRRFYLSETPASHISLPSITLDEDLPPSDGLQLDDSFGFQDVWSLDRPHPTSNMAQAFRPGPLGKSEVVFGSKA